MPHADSWHIKSRAHQCSVSEKDFDDGEPFFTALFPDPESGGFLRLDFSQEAWDSMCGALGSDPGSGVGRSALCWADIPMSGAVLAHLGFR